MANTVDPVLSHHTSQERQPAAVPELPNNQPHQSPKQSNAEDHIEQIEATNGGDIAEEQAGYRAGRSTTEQIFNLRILREKHLQHPQDLYHVFIDFKMAFDRVLHAALWATMKKYNTNLIRAIKNLYDKATKCSPLQQQHRRLVPNNGLSPTWMFTVTHPLQHISGKNHDRRLRRS